MTIPNVNVLTWVSIDGGSSELFATLSNTVAIGATPNTFAVAPFGFYSGTTGNQYSDGVIVDNLESGYAIQIFIGGLVKTIAPYCRSKFKLDRGIGLVTFSFPGGDDLANTLTSAQTFNLIFYKGSILDAESEELNAVKALASAGVINNTFLQSGHTVPITGGIGVLIGTVLNPPSLPVQQWYIETINMQIINALPVAAGTMRLAVGMQDSVSGNNILEGFLEFNATAAVTVPVSQTPLWSYPFRAKISRFAGLNAVCTGFQNITASTGILVWSISGQSLP